MLPDFILAPTKILPQTDGRLKMWLCTPSIAILSAFDIRQRTHAYVYIWSRNIVDDDPKRLILDILSDLTQTDRNLMRIVHARKNEHRIIRQTTPAVLDNEHKLWLKQQTGGKFRSWR